MIARILTIVAVVGFLYFLATAKLSPEGAAFVQGLAIGQALR